MACVVIMAGGRGERFWPRSRLAMPKQFLNLIGDKTMLQLTAERVQGLVAPEDIYIVTGAGFKEIVCRQLPQVPADNVLVEPVGRDTAAAVGLAAVAVRRKNPCEVMVVLPADHYIHDTAGFRAVLKGAVAAAGRGEAIVTLGIAPTRPETGYGYILQGEEYDVCAGIGIRRAARFLEKPDYELAAAFLASGDYLWNSGIFVWRVDLISKLIEAHLPALAAGLRMIEQAGQTEQYEQILAEVYHGLPRVSVDYGILERADKVLVIRCDFGWDDLGSWTALSRYGRQDENGNVLNGAGVVLETQDTYVYSPEHTVAVVGVKDLIVVCAGGCLLVCHKDKAQEIKKAVQALSDQGLDDAL